MITVTPGGQDIFPVNGLGQLPCEGAYCVRVPVIFDGSGDDVVIDLTAIQNTGHFSAAQTIFVNNVLNSAPITVTCSQSLQQFEAPIGGFCYMPILQPNPPRITVNCTIAITVEIQFINFFLPPVVWGPTVGGASALGNNSYHLSGGSTASTNAVNVKASQGILYNITAINTSGTIGYLRFYDLSGVPNPASAVGAHAPVIPIPANTSGAGVTVNLGPNGMAFSAGIGFVITGGGADNDNTNGPAGIFVSLLYE